MVHGKQTQKGKSLQKSGQTSWGGTPKVIVRKSTFWYDSMHGSTKKMPEMVLMSCLHYELSYVLSTIYYIGICLAAISPFFTCRIPFTFFFFWKNSEPYEIVLNFLHQVMTVT